MTVRKPVVFVTRKLPAAVEERLMRDYEPRLNEDDRVLGPDERIAGSAGADAILTCATDPWPAALIARLPGSVRALATFSAGFEHIDLAAASERGITVTNTPDVLTEAIADIAMLCLLGAARRAFEGEALLRTGGWTVYADITAADRPTQERLVAAMERRRAAPARDPRDLSRVARAAEESPPPRGRLRVRRDHPDPRRAAGRRGDRGRRSLAGVPRRGTRTRGPTRSRDIRRGRVRALEFEDHAFDVALAHICLTHVPGPDQKAEARRRVETGAFYGSIVFASLIARKPS